MKITKETIVKMKNETKNSLEGIKRTFEYGEDVRGMVDYRIRKANTDFYLENTEAYVDKLNAKQDLFNLDHRNGSHPSNIDRNEAEEIIKDSDKTMKNNTLYKHAALAGVLFAVENKIASRGFLYWLRHPINTYRENKALTMIKDALKENNVSDKELCIYRTVVGREAENLPNEINIENGEISYKYEEEVKEEVVEEVKENEKEDILNDFVEIKKEEVVEEKVVEEEKKEEPIKKVEIDLENGDVKPAEENVINEAPEEPKKASPTKRLLNERKTILGFMETAYQKLMTPNQKMNSYMIKLTECKTPIGVEINQKMQEETGNKAIIKRNIVRNTIMGTRAKLHCLDAYRAIRLSYAAKENVTPEEREIMIGTIDLMKKELHNHKVTDIEMETALSDRDYREKIIFADCEILKEDVKESEDLGYGYKFQIRDDEKFDKFYMDYAIKPSSTVTSLFPKGLTQDVLDTLQSSGIDTFSRIDKATATVSLDEIEEDSIMDKLEEFETDIDKVAVSSDLEKVD